MSISENLINELKISALDGRQGDCEIVGTLLGEEIIIYEEGGHDRPQALFIVKACNNHNNLVIALEKAQKKISLLMRTEPPLAVALDEDLNFIRKTLAAAKAVQ